MVREGRGFSSIYLVDGDSGDIVVYVREQMAYLLKSAVVISFEALNALPDGYHVDVLVSGANGGGGNEALLGAQNGENFGLQYPQVVRQSAWFELNRVHSGEHMVRGFWPDVKYARTPNSNTTQRNKRSCECCCN